MIHSLRLNQGNQLYIGYVDNKNKKGKLNFTSLDDLLKSTRQNNTSKSNTSPHVKYYLTTIIPIPKIIVDRQNILVTRPEGRKIRSTRNILQKKMQGNSSFSKINTNKTISDLLLDKKNIIHIDSEYSEITTGGYMFYELDIRNLKEVLVSYKKSSQKIDNVKKIIIYKNSGLSIFLIRIIMIYGSEIRFNLSNETGSEHTPPEVNKIRKKYIQIKKIQQIKKKNKKFIILKFEQESDANREFNVLNQFKYEKFVNSSMIKIRRKFIDKYKYSTFIFDKYYEKYYDVLIEDNKDSLFNRLHEKATDVADKLLLLDHKYKGIFELKPTKKKNSQDNEIHVDKSIFDILKLPIIDNNTIDHNIISKSFNTNAFASGSYGRVYMSKNRKTVKKISIKKENKTNSKVADLVKQKPDLKQYFIPHYEANNTLYMQGGMDINKFLYQYYQKVSPEEFKRVAYHIILKTYNAVKKLTKHNLFFTDLKSENIICVRTGEDTIKIYLGDIGSCWPARYYYRNRSKKTTNYEFNNKYKQNDDYYYSWVTTYGTSEFPRGGIYKRKSNETDMIQFMNEKMNELLTIYIFDILCGTAINVDSSITVKSRGKKKNIKEVIFDRVDQHSRLGEETEYIWKLEEESIKNILNKVLEDEGLETITDIFPFNEGVLNNLIDQIKDRL